MSNLQPPWKGCSAPIRGRDQQAENHRFNVLCHCIWHLTEPQEEHLLRGIHKHTYEQGPDDCSLGLGETWALQCCISSAPPASYPETRLLASIISRLRKRHTQLLLLDYIPTDTLGVLWKDRLRVSRLGVRSPNPCFQRVARQGHSTGFLNLPCCSKVIFLSSFQIKFYWLTACNW